MKASSLIKCVSLGILLIPLNTKPAQACCAVASIYNHVVNASQNVIILWNKEKQTQHFIRQANFKTDAKDIGFLVPSPSRPQLEESGNEAFDHLRQITTPVQRSGISIPFGCAVAPHALSYSGVTVIEEKRVAGYDATVLKAKSGDDLVNWLKKNGYSYSPAVSEWAKPYIGGNWYFTALKLAKNTTEQANQTIKASSLRITFKTDRPLFPYREPESQRASAELDTDTRLLKIYFIADTQYVGKINGTDSWSGKTKWSGDITNHRDSLLGKLMLTANQTPSTWWLTVFEDEWPYEKAAGDLYFSPAKKQKKIGKDATAQIPQTDASTFVMAACLLWVVGRKRSMNS